MKTFNKLVRDKIPEIIEASNRTYETSILESEEYVQELQKKLKEEVQEYLEAENIEELADIMEVVFALANVHGATEQDLMNVRNQKREDRGGFDKRIFLISTEE